MEALFHEDYTFDRFNIKLSHSILKKLNIEHYIDHTYLVESNTIKPIEDEINLLLVSMFQENILYKDSFDWKLKFPLDVGDLVFFAKRYIGYCENYKNDLFYINWIGEGPNLQYKETSFLKIYDWLNKKIITIHKKKIVV